MAGEMAPNRCPACGSYESWHYVGENKEGISGGKAIAGGLLFGEIGMVAGAASGKKVHKYHCAKCGLSNTYKNKCARTLNPSAYSHLSEKKPPIEIQQKGMSVENKAVYQTRVAVTSDNYQGALIRIELFLEDGEWEKADEYCEAVLDYNPKCVNAYIGKVMAKLNVRCESLLAEQKEPFDSDPDFQKAVRFSSDEERVRLEGYIQTIEENNRNEANEKIYISAKSKANGTLQGYEKAIHDLEKIEGWKDADYLKQEYIDKKHELEIELEKRRIEREEVRKKKEEEKQLLSLKLIEENERKRKDREDTIKKLKPLFIFTGVGVLAAIVILIISSMVIAPYKKYNKACKLANNEHYSEAISVFEELGNYKDVEEMLIATQYLYACQLMEMKEFSNALVIFNSLSEEYKDVSTLIEQCKSLKQEKESSRELLWESLSTIDNYVADKGYTAAVSNIAEHNFIMAYALLAGNDSSTEVIQLRESIPEKRNEYINEQTENKVFTSKPTYSEKEELDSRAQTGVDEINIISKCYTRMMNEFQNEGSYSKKDFIELLCEISDEHCLNGIISIKSLGNQEWYSKGSEIFEGVSIFSNTINTCENWIDILEKYQIEEIDTDTFKKYFMSDLDSLLDTYLAWFSELS